MTADYLDKSPDAARMGKAAELLVAASAILATRGAPNVSTSVVEDDGVDLVLHAASAKIDRAGRNFPRAVWTGSRSWTLSARG